MPNKPLYCTCVYHCDSTHVREISRPHNLTFEFDKLDLFYAQHTTLLHTRVSLSFHARARDFASPQSLLTILKLFTIMSFKTCTQNDVPTLSKLCMQMTVVYENLPIIDLNDVQQYDYHLTDMIEEADKHPSSLILVVDKNDENQARYILLTVDKNVNPCLSFVDSESYTYLFKEIYPDNYLLQFGDDALVYTSQNNQKENITTPQPSSKSDKKDDSDMYLKHKAIFERNHFAIDGIFYIEKLDGIHPLKDTQVRNKLATWSYKKTTFYNKWLKDGFRREYVEMGQYPPGGPPCPNNIYNTWRPYPVERMETEYKGFVSLRSNPSHLPSTTVPEWTLIPCEDPIEVMESASLWEYVKLIAWENCGHVVDHYMSYMQMMGHACLKPFEKPNKSIAFQGPQGSGKSFLSEELPATLFGRWRVASTSKPSATFTGHFTGALDTFLFVILSEIEKKDLDDSSGALKKMISDILMIIHMKGHEPITKATICRILLNFNAALKSGIKRGSGCRRYLVAIGLSTLVELPEFWKYCRELLNMDDQVRWVYNMLKQVPFAEHFASLKIATSDESESRESDIFGTLLAHLTESLDDMKKRFIIVSQDGNVNQWPSGYDDVQPNIVQPGRKPEGSVGDWEYQVSFEWLYAFWLKVCTEFLKSEASNELRDWKAFYNEFKKHCITEKVDGISCGKTTIWVNRSTLKACLESNKGLRIYGKSFFVKPETEAPPSGSNFVRDYNIWYTKTENELKGILDTEKRKKYVRCIQITLPDQKKQRCEQDMEEENTMIDEKNEETMKDEEHEE